MGDRLAGKVALITGTAGGQGRAAALLFAAEGASVVGCDLKAEEARETVAMVQAAGGQMTSMQPVDLGDSAAARAWVAEAAGGPRRIRRPLQQRLGAALCLDRRNDR